MADLALSTLIPLDQVDPALVEHVLDEAFGSDRHGRTAYAIRKGTDWLPALSFAALDPPTRSSARSRPGRWR
jgi:predicted N-acetyltransferase YhbS